MSSLVPSDTREDRIDLAADRIAYLVVSYGLLLSVAYRSFVNGDAAWDLIGLVVLGGIVGVAYRARQGAMSGRWTLVLVATIGVAFVVAGLLAMAGR
jgi:hypothetical protein